MHFYLATAQSNDDLSQKNREMELLAALYYVPPQFASIHSSQGLTNSNSIRRRSQKVQF